MAVLDKTNDFLSWTEGAYKVEVHVKGPRGDVSRKLHQHMIDSLNELESDQLSLGLREDEGNSEAA